MRGGRNLLWLWVSRGYALDPNPLVSNQPSFQSEVGMLPSESHDRRSKMLIPFPNKSICLLSSLLSSTPGPHNLSYLGHELGAGVERLFEAKSL